MASPVPIVQQFPCRFRMVGTNDSPSHPKDLYCVRGRRSSVRVRQRRTHIYRYAAQA